MAINLCKDPDCYNYGRYCRLHATGKLDAAKKADAQESKAKKGIAHKSEKRTELDKEYAAVSKPLWQGKKCAIKSPHCTKKAQGWNHHAGKENDEKLLDMENGEPACNACNSYVEDNHTWAVENGFRTQRNTPTNRYKNTLKKGK